MLRIACGEHIIVKEDKSISIITRIKLQYPEETASFEEQSKIVINNNTTGQLYGFISTYKGKYVFKSHRPGKIGKGQQCENVSNMKIHREKIVELGKILVKATGEEYQLTEEILDRSTRKISNVKRVCMLLDIVLRYMDNMYIEGKCWFYRPIQALRAGHLGA
jgi:hypothetical protein